MSSVAVPVRIRRLIMTGFVLTVPTLLFWCSVSYSLFTRNHTFVDAMLAGGVISHMVLVAILPASSFLLALVSRALLRRMAIERNLWHKETPEMRANQRLISWNVVLMSITIISLINN